MTPEQFIAHWKNNATTERAGAQQHFSDLCDLLGVEKLRDPENYCFERGAGKSSGGNGWADAWKRGHFGWENKKPGRDLNAALKQLTDYALQLENPPLLVVCDRERIVIHTAFTGYPDEARQILKWVFTDPEKLRPEKSTAAITAQAAGQFAQLAAAMRSRGEDGQHVAHFLVQRLFCMFAEDEQLLPAGIFTDLLKNAGKAARRLNELREAWLDPAEWVDWVITPEEEKAGFPKRPVAKPGHEAGLAGPRPPSTRPSRRHRLPLARLHPRNARRRNPPPPAGAESGTGGRLMRVIHNRTKQATKI